MAGSNPIRKSRRARAPNPRYSLDALQNQDLGDSSDDAGLKEFCAELAAVTSAGQDEDDDFSDNEAVAEEREDEEHPVADPDDDAQSAEEEAAAEDGEPDEDYNEEVIDADGNVFDVGKTSSRRNATSTWTWTTQSKPAGNYDKGITTNQNKAVRNGLYQIMYGEEEGADIGVSLERWANDLTFPSRHFEKGTGGFAYPLGYEDGVQESEDEESDLRPFFPLLEEIWKQCRSSRITLPDDARSVYLPKCPFPLGLLAGPYDQQMEHTLKPQQTTGLTDLFPPIPKKIPKKPQKAQSQTKTDVDVRKGWVLNAGGRVLSIAWAPSKTGASQYLAISIEHQEIASTSRSSFIPSDPYPASIQIWRFPNEAGEDDPQETGEQQPGPKLVRVICADWGNARRIVWCPGLLTQDRPDSTIQIGILAAVWADGCVRVLEVDEVDDQDIFAHYTRAAFTARPPDTICSCLDWLNTEDLAAGCANGFLAVWNVTSRLGVNVNQTKEPSSKPRPWLYQVLSDSYIVSLVSARPIAPHLVETISAAGYQQLTDVRNPRLEFAVPARSRLYQTSAAFSHHLQCFVTTDESGDVVVLNPRRFFNVKRSAPSSTYPSQGAVVATSPLHCSALFGTPEGAVTAINPTRRLIKTKIHAWSQKWFVHEWRPAKLDPDQQAAVGEADVKPGVVRMSEGYKVERIQVELSKKAKKSSPNDKIAHVFEEQQSVTALAWNPNLDCGGWAAAGMGSGLVRLEDIAVDNL